MSVIVHAGITPRLPTASVSTAIYVEHLAGYLAWVCQVENRVDDVFYSGDLAHRLQCPKMLLGIILVQRVLPL